MTEVTITYEQLKSKRACEDGLELFKKTFPKGISVTSEEELVAIAKKSGKGFYIYWAAEKLLLGNYYDNYLEVERQAYDKYQEVKQLACDKCEEDKRQAYAQVWDNYREVKQQAFDEYKIVKQLSYEEYKIVKQQAEDEYFEVRAIVFAELYYQQESTKVEGS
jgi:hypothetical protein